MKRKKISTTPPKKDKETPAKEENSFLVGLMKKHDISYDQALKMAIQMDAEKDIFNVSKINLLLQPRSFTYFLKKALITSPLSHKHIT